MPYAPHNRITLSGTFGTPTSPIEEWSWSFATSPSTGGSPSAMQSLATEVQALYGTHLKAQFGGNVWLTRTRAAAITETGNVAKTGDGAFIQGDNLSQIAGTGTQASQPTLQQALVVTLLTARAGSTGRGRMFLPWPIHAVNTTYVLPQANVDLVATAVANFLSAVALSNSFVGGIEVSSSKGYSSPVTSLRVGNVPDTMRSRRGRMIEQYSTRTVTS